MTQFVGYYEDNPQYEEGPFVAVNAHGFRVEVEHKGHHCPVLPNLSIVRYMESVDMPLVKTDSKKEISKVVDHLNQLVSDGIIRLEGNSWIHPDFFDFELLEKVRKNQ